METAATGTRKTGRCREAVGQATSTPSRMPPGCCPSLLRAELIRAMRERIGASSFGKRARRGGVVSCGARAVSRCRRHFPDCANGHGPQARPEGESLLPRVHDEADDEVVVKSLS